MSEAQTAPHQALDDTYQQLIEINNKNAHRPVHAVDLDAPKGAVAQWVYTNKRLQAIAHGAGLQYCLMQQYEIFIAEYPNELPIEYLHSSGYLHTLGIQQGKFVVHTYARRPEDSLHPATPIDTTFLDDFIEKHEDSYWWIVHPQKRFF
ncbi:MAG TPA: hypothetical protein EYN67_15435 [Flavobacteriales bacterium]|nr:hypothetical protein [Flavobacteriales bacterium]